MDEEKYSLIGVGGNAFSIMAYVARAMRAEGKTSDEIKAYRDEAMSGNYDELLRTSIDIISDLNDGKDNT